MNNKYWVRILAVLLVILLMGCAPKNTESNNSLTDKEAGNTQSSDTENDTELTNAQKRSIAMLNYLTVTAEKICVSKHNRLILEDIHSDLINDITPGAVDDYTKEYLRELQDTIKKLMTLDSKRGKLLYIYNQQKAAAIREATPDPQMLQAIGEMSAGDLEVNWPMLTAAVAVTIVDTYNNYMAASEKADQDYLLSGWDLDDEEKKSIFDSQTEWFSYTQTIVENYGDEGETDGISFGNLTLTLEAVSKFAQICAEDEVYSKTQSLESSYETYKLLGNYWIELADCYYELKEYEKCLKCLDEYTQLDNAIFRKNFSIVPMLPKAIDAARNVYSGEEYILISDAICKAIIENSNDSDWAIRYFAAQTYLDLYVQSGDKAYLHNAYDITLNNVNVLKKDQEKLNEEYLSELELEKNPFENIENITEGEKDRLKSKKKDEQKRVDQYNKELEQKRKTELPQIYDPLVLNCELLFALAEKLNINDEERTKISNILKTEKGDIFLSIPINEKYRFNSPKMDFSVELSKKDIVIPANLLASGATITVTVTAGEKTSVFDDFTIDKVEREGNTVDSFKAKYKSDKMKEYKWSPDATVKIEISNGDYCDPIVLHYKVKDYKGNWIFMDLVTFEKIEK